LLIVCYTSSYISVRVLICDNCEDYGFCLDYVSVGILNKVRNMDRSWPMVSVIIPVYNEAQTIGRVVSDVRRSLEGHNPFEIIVVDDGSTDGIGSSDLPSKADKFITHKTNCGYGAALKTGFRNASGDVIIIIDGDGTYPASEIPKLLSALESCDMAVGARTGKEVHIPFFRQPAKYLLSNLANFLAATRIPDLNSGLRAFKKSALEPFLNILPRGFSLTTTLTLAFLCNDFQVEYVPIDYYARQGKSKVRPIRDTKNIILTIIRTILYFNPLKVCIPLGLILLVLALGVLAFSYFALERIMDGTVAVLTLTGIQVMVIGLLADLIAKRSIR
jgi:glycosyltransferase involved in cell wall biosynthesis